MIITQDLIHKLFTYDNNGFLLWKIKHCQKVNINDKAGYISKSKKGNRRKITLYGKCLMASRLIFLYHNGYLPEIVDHQNRNPSDDRIENLRAANYMFNNTNRKSAKGSKSKYLGVCFHKSTGKWYARINVNKKLKNIGLFNTEELAALAYNKDAVKHHKEFANLNIITNGK